MKATSHRSRTHDIAHFTLGAAAAIVATLLAVRPSGPEVVAADHAHARKLSAGALDDLRQQAMEFAPALEGHPADQELWLGFHRLVALALTRSDDDLLRRRLFSLAGVAGAPSHATEAVRLLRVERGK